MNNIAKSERTETTAARPSGLALTLIGLVLALGLPFCRLGDIGRAWGGLGPLWSGEVLWWVLFAVIIVFVLAIERRSLSSIGYRQPGIWNVVIGVVAAFIAFMGSGVIFSVVLPALHLSVTHQLNGVLMAPLVFRLLTVTRAAFVEETLFRGYGFERLSELSGSTLLAACITFALFTLAHLAGGGWGQVIIAAWGGLVLTLLYVWRRNIWTNIVCHWLTDAGAFILLPMMMAHRH